MRALDAQSALERFVAAPGGDLQFIDASQAVNLVTSWYEAQRADDVDLDDNGDMLLFQWGTYDWGNGPSFQYDITRQFILVDEEDDDAIWQLSVTLHYPPTEVSRTLGSGNRWCARPEQVMAFRDFIQGTNAAVYAGSLAPARIEIRLGQAG